MSKLKKTDLGKGIAALLGSIEEEVNQGPEAVKEVVRELTESEGLAPGQGRLWGRSVQALQETVDEDATDNRDPRQQRLSQQDPGFPDRDREPPRQRRAGPVGPGQVGYDGTMLAR